jgi:hypothetical protein
MVDFYKTTSLIYLTDDSLDRLLGMNNQSNQSISLLRGCGRAGRPDDKQTEEMVVTKFGTVRGGTTFFAHIQNSTVTT